MSQKTIVLSLFVACILTSFSKGEWISEGDYVVTVTNCKVMDGYKLVRRLEKGINFQVKKVNGSWLNINQELDGKKVNGWISKNDLLKINASHRAIYSEKKSLERDRWQLFWLASGMPLAIKYESNYAADFYVISEEGKASLKWISKNGSGQISTKRAQERSRGGTINWRPPNNDQYYLLIDNSEFPDGGSSSGRTITYKLAFCIESPRPDEPRSGKGLLIGKATIDFDGYKGRNDRYNEPYSVHIDCIDKDRDRKILKAKVDEDGYFFLENVDVNCRYNLLKLVNNSMEAPVSGSFNFRFRGEESDKQVHDIGCYSLRITSQGKIKTRVDSEGFSSRPLETGETQMRFMTSDFPLDRHDWFLRKFPSSGWVKMVREDRDAIYKKREEDLNNDKEGRKKQKDNSNDIPPAPSDR